jgi:hypothetical protein
MESHDTVAVRVAMTSVIVRDERHEAPSGKISAEEQTPISRSGSRT